MAIYRHKAPLQDLVNSPLFSNIGHLLGHYPILIYPLDTQGCNTHTHVHQHPYCYNSGEKQSETIQRLS